LNREYIYDLLSNMNIVMDAFDPWDPEYNINEKSIKLIDIDNNDLSELSCDQKQILSILWNYKKINVEYVDNLIHYDIKLYNMCYNISNPYILLLLYDLLKKIITIKRNIVLFNNKFIKMNNMDLMADHIEMLLIIKSEKYERKLIELFHKILSKGLRIYIYLKNFKFVQLFGDVVPFYYNNSSESGKQNDYIDIKKINNEFINNILHFNISHHEPFILEFYKNNNVRMSNQMYVSYDKNYNYKHPWIDVILAKSSNNSIIIDKYDIKDNFRPKEIYIKPINKSVKSININKKNIIKSNKINKLFYGYISTELQKMIISFNKV